MTELDPLSEEDSEPPETTQELQLFGSTEPNGKMQPNQAKKPAQPVTRVKASAL